MGMDQLINSLPAFLRAAGETEEIAEVATIAVWNHVAGEVLRQQTVATRLRNHKLTVAVSDPVWQQQLQSMSGQFLFRLNSLLGQGSVRLIEFRVDPAILRKRNDEQGQLGTLPKVTPPAVQPIPFELVSAAAQINDRDLRRAFLGAASSSVRRRETKHED
jgi:hypothetical protein